ncbi:TetR/AcrR family transcriptional regulator [Pseudoalteromonas sp. T1lg65]|uniref:TetR/AcrR family transcriptional regulator n=1 Tax=Pseudoalteromonas sp. T1lg65 TaxID=2077101 RepID=UPI003F79CB14
MRVAEFDREAVLRKTINVFVTYGYNKTSMAKLTEATGLHPGSIYCAFKNKRGLLLAAIEQYQTDRLNHYQQLLNNCPSLHSAIEAFWDDLIAECLCQNSSKICLLTKTLAEIDGQDPELQAILNNNLRQFEAMFAELFIKQWPDQLTISDMEANARAQFFAMSVYGIRTYAATDNSETKLRALTQRVSQCVLTEYPVD